MNSGLECNFCHKNIPVSEIALTFKDGRMCNSCARKFNLLASDGYPSTNVIGYCSNHTVKQFNEWVKSSQELGLTPSSKSKLESKRNTCTLCSNPTNDYLKFMDESIVCLNCGQKYGLASDGIFSDLARRYADKHDISQLKKMLDEYGEFNAREAVIQNNETIHPIQVQTRSEHQTTSSNNRDKHSFFYYVGVVVVIIFGFNFIGGFIRGCSNTTDDDNETENISSKKSSKESSLKEAKENAKARALNKDTNKAIGQDMATGPAWGQYINHIKYLGNGAAEVQVNSSFLTLSNTDKTSIANDVRNEVLSNIQDVDTDEVGLTFYNGSNYIGRTKTFNDKEYKWKD